MSTPTQPRKRAPKRSYRRSEIPPEAHQTRLKSIPEKFRGGYLRALHGDCAPRSAIKAMCLECVGWSIDDVRNCQGYACPLYVYRPYKLDAEVAEWSNSVR